MDSHPPIFSSTNTDRGMCGAETPQVAGWGRQCEQNPLSPGLLASCFYIGGVYIMRAECSNSKLGILCNFV